MPTRLDAFESALRELDDEMTRRCEPITISARQQVEDNQPADLYEPLTPGRIARGKLVPMAGLVAGRHPDRTSPEKISLHKYNSVAIHFVAAAAVALDRAASCELGRTMPAVLVSSGRAERPV